MRKIVGVIAIASAAVGLSSCVTPEKSFSETLNTSTTMTAPQGVTSEAFAAAAPTTTAVPAATVRKYGRLASTAWPEWAPVDSTPPAYRFFTEDSGLPTFGPFALVAGLATAGEKFKNAVGSLTDAEMFCIDVRKAGAVHKLLSGNGNRVSAMEAYRYGDFRRAKALALQEMRMVAPMSVEAGLTMGRAAMVHADSALPRDEAVAHDLWRQSMDVLERVGSPDQKTAVAIEYAKFLIDRRRAREAAGVIGRINGDALADEQDRMRVLTLRARLAAEEGRVMDALHWFDQAYAYWEGLENQGEEAGRSLASALIGQLSPSDDIFNPPSLEAARILGYAAEILRAAGQYQKAAAMADAAVAKTRANETCMAPERVRFVGLRGLIRFDMGDMEGAIEDVDRLKRMIRWTHGYYTQYSADGRYLNGLVAEHEKDLAEAELSLRNALWVWSGAGGRADAVRASVALANLYRRNDERAAADWHLKAAISGAENLPDAGVAATADLTRRIKRSAYLSLMWQSLDSDGDPGAVNLAFQAAQRAVEGPVQAVASAVVAHLGKGNAEVGELLVTQARLEQDVARMERQSLDDALGGTAEMMRSVAKAQAEDSKPSGPFGMFGGRQQQPPMMYGTPFPSGAGMQAQMEAVIASVPAEYRNEVRAMMEQGMPGQGGQGDLALRRQDLETVRATLAARLGDKASAVMPPVSAATVQAALRTGEALVLMVSDRTETAVFAITPAAMHVARMALGEDRIRAMISHLRHPLEGRVGAFDAAAAAEMYDALLKPVAEGLAGAETLYLVKDGALSTLPFSVLKPEGAGGPWLVERHALATLPAVSTLTTRSTTTGQRKLRFLGVGAVEQDDLKAAAQQVDDDLPLRGLDGAFSGAVSVRALPSLPNTGGELKRLAQVLAPNAHTVLIGRDATERGFRAAKPEAFNVLAFATHAVMPGEVLETREASIVLGADAGQAAGLDPKGDGLLTAGEIAGLDLSADWVVLSACNTAAAGDSYGGDALSGLAKAFMMSGADSLMVSHWYVADEAAKELTTSTAGNIAAGMPYHQALRKAMLEVMAKPQFSHPRAWAPFVMIGGA